MKSRRFRHLVERLESRRLLSHPAFLGVTYYPTGASPTSVVTADFNGDCKQDLAVANSDDDSISVLLNIGDRTFAAKVDYVIGQTPASMTAADLNEDGKVDLAIVYSSTVPFTTTYVRVLLNQGNGTFASGGDFYAGGGPAASGVYVPPSCVTAADFNGDARVDLAVGTSEGGAVNVLLNSGGGTFSSSFPYYTNFIPASVMAADFNGDNRPDLAAMSPGYPGAVRVLLNNGDGTFVATADYLLSGQPRSIAIADFNADGRPDLAVSTDGFMTVLLNNGNGSFAPGINYRTSAYYGSGGVHYTRIVAADFNGDGKVDIAAASLPGSQANPFTLILNNGNGTFGSPIEYPGPNPYSVMAAADFNGDGRIDLAWVNTFLYANPLGVGVLLNAGDSIFAARTDYLQAQTRPFGMLAADYNGDGRLDLFIRSSFGPLLYVNNGDGSFNRGPYPGFSGGDVRSLADLNGDGRPDAVSTGYVPLNDGSGGSATELRVQLNQGNGTFGPFTGYITSRQGLEVVVADFNGDGHPDIVVSSRFAANTTVLLNNGDGTFAMGEQYAGSGQMTVADFNGDGKLDVAVSAATDLRLLLNNGDGTFSAGADYPAVGGSIASADFNSDGAPDIALNNDSGLFLFLNNGAGSFTMVALSLYPFPPISSYIVAADFDGDGKVDLASMGRLLLNNGGGTFARPLGFAVGPGARDGAIISADFNGDGKPDLAWPNLYDNSFSVMLNVAPPPVVQSASFDYKGPQQKLRFQISGDVWDTLSVGNLLVTNVPGGAPASVLNYSFDPASHTAIFTLPTPLPDGNYRATLLAAGVHDAAGTPLAADYTFDFFVLSGDANHDRVVNVYDLAILATNWLGSWKTYAQGDFNYDGKVNAVDLGILGAHWQQSIAPPALPLPVQPTTARPAARSATRTPTRLIDLV